MNQLDERRGAMQKKKTGFGWQAAALCGLLLLFIGSFFAAPHSVPDDDWAISYLVAGRMGPLGNSPYVNPILIGLLKMLSGALPLVNVYEVFRVLMIMGAFAAIFVCAFRLLPGPAAFAAGALLVFIYWKDTMLEYNYTFGAGLCAGAAVLLLYCYAARQLGMWAAIAGAALWLLAFMWRREAALLLVPYGVLMLACFCLQARRKDAGFLWPEKKRWMALGLVAALSVAAALYAGAVWSRPEWAAYQRFNQARTAAVDYSLAPWDEVQNKLEPLGITENDYWCAQNWVLADPEVFSTERMEAIAEQKVTADHDDGFALQALRYFLRAPLRVRACSAFLLLFLLAMLTGGIWQRFAVLCAGGGSCVISLYFFWQGRLIDRVEAVIWLGAVCVALVQSPQRLPRGRGAAKLAGGLAGAALLAVTGWRMLPLTLPNSLLSAQYQVTDKVIQTTLLGNNYYLWDVLQGGESWANAYGNVHLPTREFFDHNGYLGGWTERSPALLERRARLGLENPIRALVEKENVYLIDTARPDRILKLLQEHYEPLTALSTAQKMDEDLWALAFTTPQTAHASAALSWRLEELSAVSGNLGWYTITGSAQGLDQAADLWLRMENAAGESRCYRLVNHENGSFGTGLYLDWTAPDAGLEYTLLWRQADKIYESADKK